MTEKAEHTPGPWELDNRSQAFHRIAAEKELIAEIYGWELGNGKANARLIAAAPTMRAYIAKKAEEGDAEAQAIIANL